ncbi:amidase [Pseudomassariella vexata]|uniref:Amidase n=1 Tax=Pseudomassariella vexata TaxID=1141098 RepID=A0A1Y2DGW6_9PEZI|nr:amidase [Pseudomassariella vexata]ORY58477.1 amidase [Pseudomassariella vexata]
MASDEAKTQVSRETFREIMAPLGFSMKPEDEVGYLELLENTLESMDIVDQMPEYIDPRLKPNLDPDNTPRAYRRPTSEENPLNAWSHRTELKSPNPESSRGHLAGKTLAAKDNICLSGIPLTGGTQEYHLCRQAPYPIPDIDAPVISRVLEAGATVLGTSTCENYCMSGLSLSSATGPVQNPWLKGYSCGGSSSGSAALVGVKVVRRWREARGFNVQDGELGEGVDLAIGGDQGGSIRIPAAYTGIYGLKPTHGLIPYTGICPLHPLIDHAGPMASSVRDLALLLTVLAGYDGIDPRMTPECPLRSSVPSYHDLLDDAIAVRKPTGNWTPTTAAKGLRVGILTEAFAVPQLNPDVAATVRKAAERFRALGGEVEEVSIPLHAKAPAIFTATTREHMASTFLHNSAPTLLSYSLPNLDPPKPGQDWYETMNRSNPAVVSALVDGHYLDSQARYPPRVRAKAITHVHELRAAYDAALAKYDILITPANPTVGKKQRSSAKGDMDGMGQKGFVDLVLGNTANTMPFNVTGHPGLIMPVGWGRVEDGEGRLPVGMQIVGRRWDERTALFAAAAWEVGGLGLDEE